MGVACQSPCRYPGGSGCRRGGRLDCSWTVGWLENPKNVLTLLSFFTKHKGYLALKTFSFYCNESTRGKFV